MLTRAFGALLTSGVVAAMAYGYWYRIPSVIAPDHRLATAEAELATPSASPVASPDPTAEPPPVEPLRWGAYVGWQDEDLRNFESLVGQPVDLVADFVHWGNEREFPMHYTATARDAGKTLVIYWEAKDYNVEGPEDPRFNYDAILAGQWDDYLEAFAQAAATYGGPVILVPFNEMNDNVSPWDGTVNGNSPAKHIAGWRYVREKFRTTAPNVTFGWAVNSLSVPNEPGNQIEEYYPGDEYVDYVGVDGFNFGEPWQSFDEVFAPALTTVSQYGKPIYLFSMGSREGAQKADWIRQGLGERVHVYPISGWIWFNEDKSTNGEYDWRVNSDPQSLAAFRAVVDALSAE